MPLGQTLFRFSGAVLVGLGATAIDRPKDLFAPTARVRPPTVPVVVAARDMPQGARIDPVNLVVTQWPMGVQPAGAFSSVESVGNRVTRVPIYKGEVIVPGRLAPEGIGAGLEVKITPGKRAYGIRIADVENVAELLAPNARVDVMVVMSDPGNSGKRVAKLFMSNMRVLGIGVASGRLATSTVATLEVTPEEAERLAIAAAQGTLHLVLGVERPTR